MSLLVDRLAALARERPAAPMLIGEHDEVITRGEANARVADLTASFGSSNRPIAVAGTSSPDWLLTLLAARAAGHLVVPLPPDQADASDFIQLLGSVTVIFPDATTGRRRELGANDVRPIPGEAAFGLPTSGTTGAQKLALRTEASLLADGTRCVDALELHASDRIVLTLPLHHAFGLGFALGSVLATGCSLHILPRFKPDSLHAVLRKTERAVVPLVPLSARLLCGAADTHGSLAGRVRRVVVGAGPLSPELDRMLVAATGVRGDRGYGATESGVTLLGAARELPPAGATGRAASGVEVRVVELEQRVGPLLVRVEERFLGYLTENDVDRSRVDVHGWYSTGDLARIDEHGWVTVTGRSGLTLRQGGRSFEPLAIEEALRRHPQILDAVAIGRPAGDGEDLVEVHVEASESVPDARELSIYLRTVANIHCVVSAWHFHDKLPRGAAGKADRTRLVESGDSPAVTLRRPPSSPRR